MKYKVYCNNCHKMVEVSTRDESTVKYKDPDIKNGIVYSFDCPECGSEIKGQPMYEGNSIK